MGVLPTAKIPDRGPFRLVDIFLLLDRRLDADDKKTVLEMTPVELHMGLGKWVRNNARLWTDGVDLVVEDVMRLKNTYPIPYLEQFVAPGTVGVDDKGVDNSLLHPDNISSVVIFLYKQWLSDVLTADHLKVLEVE